MNNQTSKTGIKKTTQIKEKLLGKKHMRNYKKKNYDINIITSFLLPELRNTIKLNLKKIEEIQQMHDDNKEETYIKNIEEDNKYKQIEDSFLYSMKENQLQNYQYNYESPNLFESDNNIQITNIISELRTFKEEDMTQIFSFDQPKFKKYYSYTHDEIIQKISILENIYDNINCLYQLLSRNDIKISKLFVMNDKSYTIFDKEIKDDILSLLDYADVNVLSDIFKVSRKSNVRWSKKGTLRKKGCGRKVKDPQMEEILFKYYFDNLKKGKVLKYKDIKEKALKISNSSNFKASKGWYEKFRKKCKSSAYINKFTN